MKRRAVVIFALFACISVVLPTFATAKISVKRHENFIQKIIKSIFNSEKKENQNNENKKSAGDCEIVITSPVRGWLHIFGRPIIPYGKTAIIGSTVVVKGWAKNINMLECLIEDTKTGEIVFRETKARTPFGTGPFSFTFRGVKRGDYLIIVWEGAGFAPTAQDTLQIKVL